VDLTAVGARVRAARERAGMSQRALRELSGVSQPMIHRLETGVRTTVSLAEVDRLAQALGVPLDDLLYGSPVRERVRAAARTKGEAQVAEALEHAIALLELDAALDDLVPDLRQQRVEARVAPTLTGPSEEQGRNLAVQVREELGLGAAPIAFLPELVEQLTGIDVGTAPLPDGVSGVCAVDPQQNTAIVLVDSDEVAERQRFTLAHELGHLLAGDSAHVHAVSARRTPAEVRCDAFARNLLIPRDGVRAWLERALGTVDRRLIDERHIALLARHFGVTPEVAGIQLERMRLRTRTADPLPSGRVLAYRYGWGSQYESEQATAGQPQVPRRLTDRAIQAYRNGRLGAAALARLQGPPVAEVEQALADAGVVPRPAIRRADTAGLIRRATAATAS